MDQVVAAVFELILVVTGRFAVRLFTLGRWQSEPLGSNLGAIYGAAGALSFKYMGRRMITHTGQLFAGLVFYVLLGIIVVVVYAKAV